MRPATVAVIQARMSSTRLPGKVLMPIAGQPLLWHIVHRLRQARTVDAVAIATSDDPSDAPIAAFCAQQAVTCVRGPLHNVLERYRLAAERTGAEILLRVTGDAPLIDPGLTDYLVNGLIAADADYVQLESGALCAHEGVDVFSRRALDWLVVHAGGDPVAREHVTSWFKHNPGRVKTAHLPAYAPLAFESERLSVDTPDDLKSIRTIYQRLGAAPGDLALTDVLALLRSDPHLRDINRHVRQKPVTEVERPATARLGLGTAQFGQAYGISNLRGQVPVAETRAILARAAQAGVGLLDTAANYGEAEQILSHLDTKAFRIVSKTIGIAGGIDAVVARARVSVRLLGRLDLLLVHAAGDLLGPDGDALWSALRGLKDAGVTRGIGISAYVADDPVALARRFRPDAMQVPFSLLDQRLLQDSSLARLKDMGVEVHARSVFLQGLLFLDELPARLKFASGAMAAMRTRIARAGATPLAAALGFVLSRPEVDVAVTGVTSLDEMEEVLEAAAMPLPALDWAACALTDETLLTPSRW